MVSAQVHCALQRCSWMQSGADLVTWFRHADNPPRHQPQSRGVGSGAVSQPIIQCHLHRPHTPILTLYFIHPSPAWASLPSLASARRVSSVNRHYWGRTRLHWLLDNDFDYLAQRYGQIQDMAENVNKIPWLSDVLYPATKRHSVSSLFQPFVWTHAWTHRHTDSKPTAAPGPATKWWSVKLKIIVKWTARV